MSVKIWRLGGLLGTCRQAQVFQVFSWVFSCNFLILWVLGRSGASEVSRAFTVC